MSHINGVSKKGEEEMEEEDADLPLIVLTQGYTNHKKKGDGARMRVVNLPHYVVVYSKESI